MSTAIINELNKSVIATRTPAESSGVFAAIKLEKLNVPVRIKAITWGAIIPDTTDYAQLSGQYAMLLRNGDVNDGITFSPTAPVGLPVGSELIWTASDSKNGIHHASFPDNGLLLNVGYDYALIVPAPAFTGALNTTVYMHGTIIAEFDNLRDERANWRQI